MKDWHLIVLIAIIGLSFMLRFTATSDVLVSFDPMYQYRYVEYFTNNWNIPHWDSMTYYPGREVPYSEGYLMYLITAIIASVLGIFGVSLLHSVFVSSALFGALICIPAYLIGKEISNEYGGLLSAFFIAVAPQIFVRTFGASYDTDQLILFFILSTIYLGYMAMKEFKVSNIIWASLTFILFMLTWDMFIFGLIVLLGYLGLCITSEIIKKKKLTIEDNKDKIKSFGFIIFIVSMWSFALKVNIFQSVSQFISYIFNPAVSIVNISVAELQQTTLSLQNFAGMFGGITTGIGIIDFSVLCIMLLGMFYLVYKNKQVSDKSSFIAILVLIGLYLSLRGARFLEFSALFLVISSASGFGLLIENVKAGYAKYITFLLIIAVACVGLYAAYNISGQIAPQENQYWKNAFDYLKTTPENSIVLTWWDFGHDIATLGERRNIADGAHCQEPRCYYGINDRITDIGKIFSTSNETEAIELIDKYKGNSEKQYVIASNDMIYKFHWVQYFGTGCEECELYSPVGMTNVKEMADKTPVIYYSNIMVVLDEDKPRAYISENRRATPIKEVIYFNGTDFNTAEYRVKKDKIENELNIVVQEDEMDITLWISETGTYAVVIPENLKNAIFTKMFMFNGKGLEHFKPVVINEQVKVFERW